MEHLGGDVPVPCPDLEENRDAARERRGVFRGRRPGEMPPDSRAIGDRAHVEAGGGSWAGAILSSRERASGHGLAVTPL